MVVASCYVIKRHCPVLVCIIYIKNNMHNLIFKVFISLGNSVSQFQVEQMYKMAAHPP